MFAEIRAQFSDVISPFQMLFPTDDLLASTATAEHCASQRIQSEMPKNVSSAGSVHCGHLVKAMPARSVVQEKAGLWISMHRLLLAKRQMRVQISLLLLLL